jgi:hypothetical protein
VGADEAGVDVIEVVKKVDDLRDHHDRDGWLDDGDGVGELAESAGADLVDVLRDRELCVLLACEQCAGKKGDTCREDTLCGEAPATLEESRGEVTLSCAE